MHGRPIQISDAWAAATERNVEPHGRGAHSLAHAGTLVSGVDWRVPRVRLTAHVRNLRAYEGWQRNTWS
jgi:hypothetical protein